MPKFYLLKINYLKNNCVGAGKGKGLYYSEILFYDLVHAQILAGRIAGENLHCVQKLLAETPT